MLKIEAQPKFTLDVTVNTAAIKGSFKVTYVAKPNSELKVIEQQVAAEGTGISGFLPHVVASVSDIQLPITLPTRADGSSDCTVELAALLDWPGIGPAMQKAYYRGLWEETEKN